MSERQGGWIPLGEHRYRFEEPDIVHTVSSGATSIDEIKRVFEILEQRSAELGTKIFWLSNMARSEPMSPEVRRETSKMDVSGYLRGIAGYGASLAARTVVNMTVRAMCMLRPSLKLPPTQYCATEIEARAFIDEIRRGGKP